jgi:hypothetical protein
MFEIACISRVVQISERQGHICPPNSSTNEHSTMIDRFALIIFFKTLAKSDRDARLLTTNDMEGCRCSMAFVVFYGKAESATVLLEVRKPLHGLGVGSSARGRYQDLEFPKLRASCFSRNSEGLALRSESIKLTLGHRTDLESCALASVK